LAQLLPTFVTSIIQSGHL